VRELVIVITDLYLGPEEPGAPVGAKLPGIEQVGRFAAPQALQGGWRAWVAARIGRPDLSRIAPARIAAVAAGGAGAPCWLAAPVHLSAGLSRVHLDHRGLLQLTAPEQARLLPSFARAFAGAPLQLAALPSGDFLLQASGIEPLPGPEPGRCAGAELAGTLPAGSAALRRVWAEIEMWLHGEALNSERAQRGLPRLTALWLWGAAGSDEPVTVRSLAPEPAAFGREAYLLGLWQLHGLGCAELPADLAELLPRCAARTVLALSLAAELQRSPGATFGQALARLDECFIAPALQALRRGHLSELTLLANDRALNVPRRALLRRWRRAAAGLASLQWA
jgi:hypothetical protein